MELVIVGTGGQAREIQALVESLGADGQAIEMLGFLDDDPSMAKTSVHGMPVLGDIDWLGDRPRVGVSVGIGGTAARRRVVQRIEVLGDHGFPVLVHPDSSVGPRVELGKGSVVGAGAVLTTDVEVGSHVLMNFGCTIGHDVSIGDYATVAPGAHVSGAVRIGEGADVGTGASVIQGVSIGAWTIVGAGAVVTRDLPPNVTAVGVPASPIKERSEGWQDT